MQRKYLKKENILTIPNLLSLIRILLIPFIIWLYCAQKAYLHTIIVIALSGFTDIIDGKIARKFNMVSDVGKVLDPVADSEIKYYGKIAYMIDATEDFKFARQSIIEAGNIQKIPINTGKLKFAKPSNPKRKYALKVIIRQRTGPKKVCTAKYSYEELGTRFFGQGLFSGG